MCGGIFNVMQAVGCERGGSMGGRWWRYEADDSMGGERRVKRKRDIVDGRACVSVAGCQSRLTQVVGED